MPAARAGVGAALLRARVGLLAGMLADVRHLKTHTTIIIMRASRHRSEADFDCIILSWYGIQATGTLWHWSMHWGAHARVCVGASSEAGWRTRCEFWVPE